MIVEEVTFNVFTLVGGADGAEGKIMVYFHAACLTGHTNVLTCSECNSLEVLCFFLTTQY